MLNRLKSLASDTAIYGVLTIVGRFLTFMLTPLYTNFLTKEEVGDVNYIFTLLAFINIVYSFGMESAFFRFFGKNDRKTGEKVFTHAFLSMAFISGACSLFVFVYADEIAPYVSDLSYAPTLVRLAAIIPFLDALLLVPQGLLRMTRRAKRFTVIRLIIIFVAVALNAYFLVGLGWNAAAPFAAQTIASLVGLLIFLPEIFSYMKIKFDNSLFADMLRFGLPTLPANLASMILQVADRPILKGLTDAATLGEYQVNYKLGIPMMLFVSLFEYAWKPFYLNRFKDLDAKRVFSRVFTYFTIACAGVFLAAGLFIEFVVRAPFVGGKFINPAYWSGLDIIPIVLAAYYFNGCFNNFACGFHIEKKTQYLPGAVGVAAAVNLAMNFALIPEIGYRGAAWATLGAYFVSAAVLYIASRRVYPIAYEWKRVFIAIFATVAAFVAGNIGGNIALAATGAGDVEIGAFTSALATMRDVSPERLALVFAVRLAALGLFFLTLKLFGFLTAGEIKKIKELIKVKGKNGK